MSEFYVPSSIDRFDLKRLRKKLSVTQAELASIANVSKKTIERWESSTNEISGPITTLLQILVNNPEYIERFTIPTMSYPLRMKYMFRNQLCTVIDVDEINRKIRIKNYQNELIYRAFGKNENPSFDEYVEFLKSRCIPQERDKMKLVLRELDIPFYDPMLIIEKTEGRMAEDEFWIKIEKV